MESFRYEIKDEVGIHARPAGELVNIAKQYQSRITISKGTKSAEATKLMAMMGLGVKCGEEITVTAEGPDEKEAAQAVRSFLEKSM